MERWEGRERLKFFRISRCVWPSVTSDATTPSILLRKWGARGWTAEITNRWLSSIKFAVNYRTPLAVEARKWQRERLASTYLDECRLIIKKLNWNYYGNHGRGPRIKLEFPLISSRFHEWIRQQRGRG